MFFKHPLVGFLSPDNGGQSVIGALLATAEPLGSLRSADRREAIKGCVKTIEYFMYVRNRRNCLPGSKCPSRTPPDVQRTLSGDDASCVVAAGPANQEHCRPPNCSATHLYILALCMSENQNLPHRTEHTSCQLSFRKDTSFLIISLSFPLLFDDMKC